jgi:hypothetical protein
VFASVCALFGLAAGWYLWTELSGVGRASFPSLGVGWAVLLLASSTTVVAASGLALASIAHVLALAGRHARVVTPPLAGRVRAGAARAVAAVRGGASAHPNLFALAVLTVTAALTRTARYAEPLSRDAGQYLYVGGVILDGGVPYLDAANNKGPLTYLAFAAIDLLAGRSAVLVRITVVIATAVAALALSVWVARYAGRAVGLLAGVGLAALTALPVFDGNEVNTETYALALMLGGCALAGRATTAPAAAAGAMCAGAVAINPWFVIFVPFAAYEAWRGRDRSARFAAGMAGALAVAAPLLTWITANGALDDMLVQMAHSARAAARTSEAVGKASPLLFLLKVPFGAIWVAALLGGLLALRQWPLRPAAVLALAWMGLVWVRVKFAGYSFDHYYQPAIVGISTALSLGVAVFSATAARLVASALVLALTLGVALIEPPWGAMGETPRNSRDPWTLAYPVADFIDARTSADAPIFVAGSAPTVYWLADRRAPTRFFDDLPKWRLRSEYRRERLRALWERPPAAIALLPGEEDPRRLPGYLRPLMRRYEFRLAEQWGPARVWLRRQRPGERGRRREAAGD